LHTISTTKFDHSVSFFFFLLILHAIAATTFVSSGHI